MSNNPTIDGVSRATIDLIADRLSKAQMFKESTEVRAILDAPAVERQELCSKNSGDSCKSCGGSGLVNDGELTCSSGGEPYENGPIECVKDCPECQGAHQSTIARLEARVAELESGRGEPVGRVSYIGSGFVRVRTTECLAIEQPLFTAPTAPVATPEKYDDVLLPFLSIMRAELHANAHKGDRPGWLKMDRKTAILEVFYHMGKLHQAVHRNEASAIKEYAADVANMCMMLLDVCACLDATAALSTP